MNIRPKSRMITSFATISLTDIVFLLLVFFLLSSTYILQPGIKVELPRTASTEVSAEKAIVVTIAQDGTLYLNDKRVSRSVLPSQIRQMITSSLGNPAVVIRPDKRVSVEKLVDVIDVSKRAGAEDFLIATQVIQE